MSEAAEPASPVALDAMGGDRAPDVVVEGAVQACRAGHGPVILVGDAEPVRAALDALGAGDLPITIEHASEVIGMAEHPGRAARTKRDSSMHVGFGLVKAGRACGFVSAGNSGAMMAVGLLTLRRIPRCERPAIAGTMPTRAEPMVLLDMGANVECRASHLVQFALMGAAYAEIALGKARPTIGLLSNGTEPTKGTETLREAHRLLTMTDLKYVGYVEGRTVPQGEVDVVVTDGFVGNVVLKLSEGIALALVERVREQLRGDWLGSLGASLMKRSLRQLQSELDWRAVGGAPLLGIDGVGVVAHGGSSPEAVANAVKVARRYADVDLVGKLRAALEASAPPDEHTSTAELPITRATGTHEQP
ncbi:MAG: phosphate acyltransferase PlsX [Myxococcales bacterium]|nr:phosphate acyltransferase PlsX [Myxococcales bacterium]